MDRWMNKIYSNVCRDAAWFVQIRPRTNYWFWSHLLRGNCYPNRVRHQDHIKRARGILALIWIIHNQASTWEPLLITSNESKNSSPKQPFPSRLRHGQGIWYLYRPATGQEYSKGENEMKIKLKRNISTGLAVRTTLKAGEDYVPCGGKNCPKPERKYHDNQMPLYA